MVTAAIGDINAFETFGSPAAKLTSATRFRGETPGDRIGPYLSQFLWLDIPYGLKSLEQRYTVPTRGQSFLTTYGE